MPTRALPLLAALVALLSPAAAQAALRPPSLQAPSAGAGVETPPALTWKAVRGAAAYDVQVAADRAFGSPVMGRRGTLRTGNTAATLPENVADGTYFWRVRAVSASDRAGRWSITRSFTKAWTTAPALLEPADDLSVTWPALPLVLKWSAVPHATKYLITVATDPSLAQPVLGTTTKPVDTQGTVYALQGTLPAGRYYWAITPVDAGGFKGTRSRVGTFTWGWPSQTSLSVSDVNDAAEVYDPLLQWSPVPGAASYEVEVNPTAEFTLGSRVLSETTVATSLAPAKALPNNTYHWRVRAIDADGNAGVWNTGPVFTKQFDPVSPPVSGLEIRNGYQGSLITDSTTATGRPVITWNPVPGASGYELQIAPFSSVCEWGSSATKIVKTPNTAWTPLAKPPSSVNPPGPEAWKDVLTDDSAPALQSGSRYCVRILAFSDEAIMSSWRTAGPAFTYQAPATGSCAPSAALAGDYLSPQHGQVSRRTPLFAWKDIAGAGSYWVVIAKDPSFTNVVDVGFTRVPVYVNDVRTLSDETTSYYWAVIPAGESTGACPNGGPDDNAPRAFEKQSIPPTLITPAVGADSTAQPVFRWSAAEGARTYTLQVATDPSFGSPIDAVKTASTAYVPTKVYPVDTVLYWRVRATDGTGVALNWSNTGTFRRRLATPTPSSSNPTGGETIPLLTWSAVDGAVSYDLHVDQADGKVKDFTLRSAAFTPTLFYGTGIWRWKVRANFSSGSGTVSGPYSAAQDYVRKIGAPVGARLVKTGDRLVFRWNPDPAAEKYRVEVSSSDSFGRLVESVATPLNEWAPTLRGGGYRDGGRLYWRVASVDGGGNVGAFASGAVALPKGLRVSTIGRPRRSTTRRMTVKVLSATRRAVKGALVRVSGAGVRSMRKRTNRRGVSTFRVRPKRAGTLLVTVSRRGYRTTTVRIRVR